MTDPQTSLVSSTTEPPSAQIPNDVDVEQKMTMSLCQQAGMNLQ